MQRPLLVLFMLTAMVGTARGHATSSGALHVMVRQHEVEANVTLEVSDLDSLLVIDADGDRLASAAEVHAQAQAIAEYVIHRVELRADDRFCPLEEVEASLAGSAVVTHFKPRCPPGFTRLRVRYELFFEHDDAHRGFIRVSADDQAWSGIATADRRELLVERAHRESLRGLLAYLREGIVHIWLGFDHLLFLLTLLLPAVLARTGPEPLGLRPALRSIVKIVTAFTLAHSITLSLAALDVVRPSERVVEASIAASIIVAALLNLVPKGPALSFALAFGFGLLHGFGFANVLTDLHLPSRGVLTALLGFNLGVEVGQLCVVALFFPLAFALRSAPWYPRVVTRWGSLLVASVGMLWLLERTMDFSLFEAARTPALQRAETEYRAGIQRERQHQLQRARERFSEAAALFEKGGDEASQADVLSRLGDLDLTRADPLSARRAYLAALRLREQRGDQRGMAAACHDLTVVARARGDMTEATKWLRRALELEERLGLLPLVRRDSAQLAQLYRDTEQLDAAYEAQARAVELDETLSLTRELAQDLGKLGIIQQLRGELHDARRHYRRAIPLHEALGGGIDLAKTLANDAAVARLLGHTQEARAVYQRSLALFEQAGDPASVERVQGAMARLP